MRRVGAAREENMEEQERKVITRNQFIKAYAKSFKTTRDYSRTICDSVFLLLGKMICEEGADVTYQNFGTFKHKLFSEKRARHPETGEMLTIPQRDVIRFNPSPTILPKNKTISA